ncbi:MAG TPA: hypothetical protein VI756_19370 [Blastocatellia bacterium]
MKPKRLEKINGNLFHSVTAEERAAMIGGLQTVTLTDTGTLHAPGGPDFDIDTLFDPSAS